MAYVAITRWRHGEEITAARLNVLSGNIVFLEAFTDGVDINWATQGIGGSGGELAYFVIHRFRWLWYTGQGALLPFSGIDEASLDSGDEWAVGLDLNTLGWLHYGDFYRITGVSWALETPDA